MTKEEILTQESKPLAHVASWKREIVEKIKNEIKQYRTIAVIDMRNLPAAQLQAIRAKIKDKAKILMTKRRLIKRALEEANLSKLAEHAEGMCALLLSQKDSFELFRILKENMSAAPAKPGQEAPENIVIKAGATPFAPGPILGELGAVGIKAGIEGGKIVIKEDCVVAKKGERISAQLAGILSRLGITPVKIGLNLIAAFEDGQLYLKDVLDINIKEYEEGLKGAYLNALKLAIGAGILTKETAAYLLQQAHEDAKKLSIGCNIITDETKELIIRKAEAQVKALEKVMPNIKIEQVPDAKESERGEEPTQEEAPSKEQEQVEQPSKEQEQSIESEKRVAQAEKETQEVIQPAEEEQSSPQPPQEEQETKGLKELFAEDSQEPEESVLKEESKDAPNQEKSSN